jgi:hypothetical protein
MKRAESDRHIRLLNGNIGRQSAPLFKQNSALVARFLHDMVLKNLCLTFFLFLTVLYTGAYYARRVGKSGSKWTLLSTWR